MPTSREVTSFITGGVIAGLLLVGWVTYENTRAAPLPATPVPPAGAPHPPSAPTRAPVEVQRPVPIQPGSDPEHAIKIDKPITVTLPKGETKYYILPSGHNEVDLQILDKSQDDIARLMDSGVLSAKVYSPDQLNQLLTAWRNSDKNDYPVPKGQLTKRKGPNTGLWQYHYSGGNDFFKDQASPISGLPKGAALISITNNHDRTLKALYSAQLSPR